LEGQNVKRVIGLVVACAAASCSVAAASSTTGTSATPPKLVSPKAPAQSGVTREAARQAKLLLLAPGDEYFGTMKLSVIGIRNTLHDDGLRYDFNHDIGPQTYAHTRLTELAVRDWEKKYPRDDQLPRAVFYLQRLYTKVLTADSRARAHVVALWLFSDFANSAQSRQLKKTLATEHLAALPPPAPTAPPAGTYASDFGPKYPSDFTASPAPTPHR